MTENQKYIDETIEKFLSKSPKYYGSEMNEFVAIVKDLLEQVNNLGEGPADDPNVPFMLGVKIGWAFKYMENFSPKNDLILTGLKKLKTLKSSHTTKNNVTIKMGSNLKWWGNYYEVGYLEGVDPIKLIYVDYHDHVVAELENKKQICIEDLDKTAEENLKTDACLGWELVD